ncbi:MAG: hypothetical protein QOJ65_1091 [Fimbriimonadaceae bacterium]|jgi:hypothetical protein|nr:hypothetical protein [Fimbriimonadaceae bacterium]
MAWALSAFPFLARVIYNPMLFAEVARFEAAETSPLNGT